MGKDGDDGRWIACLGECDGDEGPNLQLGDRIAPFIGCFFTIILLHKLASCFPLSNPLILYTQNCDLILDFATVQSTRGPNCACQLI